MNALPYREWRDTLDIVHMWTRIVGKVQLALVPVAGFDEAELPSGAYHPDLREFVLPWPDPEGADPQEDDVLAFLRAAYDATADLGGWDRGALEAR